MDLDLTQFSFRLILDALGNPIPFESQGESSTHGETFSDIGLEEKKKYSHRSRAIESLLSKL